MPGFYERILRWSFPAVGGGQRSSTPPPRFPEDYHPVHSLAFSKDGTSLKQGDPLLARQRGRLGFPRRRRGRCYRSQVRLCPVFNEASVQPRLATTTIRSAVDAISPPMSFQTTLLTRVILAQPLSLVNYFKSLTHALRRNPILLPGTRMVLLFFLAQKSLTLARTSGLAAMSSHHSTVMLREHHTRSKSAAM
jgi:hypothetical protein